MVWREVVGNMPVFEQMFNESQWMGFFFTLDKVWYPCSRWSTHVGYFHYWKTFCECKIVTYKLMPFVRKMSTLISGPSSINICKRKQRRDNFIIYTTHLKPWGVYFYRWSAFIRVFNPQWVRVIKLRAWNEKKQNPYWAD